MRCAHACLSVSPDLISEAESVVEVADPNNVIKLIHKVNVCLCSDTSISPKALVPSSNLAVFDNIADVEVASRGFVLWKVFIRVKNGAQRLTKCF